MSHLNKSLQKIKIFSKTLYFNKLKIIFVVLRMNFHFTQSQLRFSSVTTPITRVKFSVLHQVDVCRTFFEPRYGAQIDFFSVASHHFPRPIIFSFSEPGVLGKLFLWLLEIGANASIVVHQNHVHEYIVYSYPCELPGSPIFHIY